MTEKELKRLSRAELLELLFEQTKESERLRKQLDRAEALLSERQIKIQNAGDLAQAVLAVNGVMEAAQAAAKQYLDNIRLMEKETQRKCRQMIINTQKEIAQTGVASTSSNHKADSEDVFMEEIHELLK